MQIHKAEIIAILRSKGLEARADWVDRELPLIVDTYDIDSLLRMLNIDPANLTPADVTPADVTPTDVTPADVAPVDVAPADERSQRD